MAIAETIRGLITKFGGQTRRSPAATPDGTRIYAVGDIHGCDRLLDQLTQTIVEDAKSAKGECVIVYLGDYVDRGLESKGVIDRLLNPPSGFQTHHLRGNHDQMLLDFLNDPSLLGRWRAYGASFTLISYGVLPPRFEDETAFVQARDQLLERLPPDHLSFLQGLSLSVRLGGYFFAHAGIRPGIALDKQVPEDLLSIREDFLDSPLDLGVVVVHGHTPTENVVRRSNRIGIDTGAYATARLTAAVLEGETCRFLHT